MAGTQTLASMRETELLAYGEEQERAARVAECNKILFAHAWAAANPPPSAPGCGSPPTPAPG